MGNLNMIITLLVIYLFIGFFGSNYGLKTSIAEDILDIDKPNSGLISSLFGLVDFIFSLVLLPLTIVLSDIHIIVKVVLEFISLLFYIELAFYIRATN